jgi:hypothetical protein
VNALIVVVVDIVERKRLKKNRIQVISLAWLHFVLGEH